MLFKSFDGKLIQINKQDYNNDIDYYKQVLKIKGFNIKNKHYDFTKFDSIEFGRQTYEERPHSRKPGELAEFYSTVTGTHNNEIKKIGEFQIHFKSRLNIKFRFFNSLFRL